MVYWLPANPPAIVPHAGMRQILKLGLHGIFLVLALPWAALAGFGRFGATFNIGAHLASQVPGIVGDYYRVAYYKLTLKQCSLYGRISFGSFFAHSDAIMGHGVYIGPYCVLGCCRIGDRTQIAGQVQILSGRRQHRRNETGQISGAVEGEFELIEIGSDCWIGASSIIMAAIGSGTTIGAGAVVVRPIEANVVAVGNPARVIQDRSPQLEGNGVTK